MNIFLQNISISNIFYDSCDTFLQQVGGYSKYSKQKPNRTFQHSSFYKKCYIKIFYAISISIFKKIRYFCSHYDKRLYIPARKLCVARHKAYQRSTIFPPTLAGSTNLYMQSYGLCAHKLNQASIFLKRKILSVEFYPLFM